MDASTIDDVREHHLAQDFEDYWRKAGRNILPPAWYWEGLQRTSEAMKYATKEAWLEAGRRAYGELS